MATQTTNLPVKLPNGAEIEVEVRRTSREGEVSASEGVPQPLPLDYLQSAIAGIAELVQTAIQQAKPSKVSVEFGLELTYKPGKVTALLVSGEAKGNLKIALEW